MHAALQTATYMAVLMAVLKTDKLGGKGNTSE